MANSVAFRFREDATDEEREEVIERIREMFLVSIGGDGTSIGILPSDSKDLDMLRMTLLAFHAVAEDSVKIEA